MKTEEDEAFDELAKRQGDWGGGFPAKRRMAADKLQEPVREALQMCLEYIETNAHERKHVRHAIQAALAQPAQDVDYWIREATAARQAEMAMRRELEAQPAQEPVAREWNFCERCGKRTADLTVIHTCTPPQEKSND
jgi:phage tail tape-measure protein